MERVLGTDGSQQLVRPPPTMSAQRWVLAALLLLCGDRGGVLSDMNTDWSPPGSCNCLTCDGVKTDDSETAACAGRTSGCSADDEHSGCYGKAKANPFYKGTCICGSGQFMQPEVYHIGGTVSGIPDGLALVLANTSPKKEGPTYTGGHAVTLTQPITWNGAWYFNSKFANDQEYKVEVYRVPKDTTCSVAGKTSGRITKDVIDLHITCKPLAKRDVASIPESLPQGARQNEAKELKEAQSNKCEDSARLTPDAQKRAFKKITTRVPCSRHFVSNAAHRDYMTEIHGHKCVEFSVSLSDLGSVCFVPERIWDSLGRAAVLSDSHLCPCKDTKTCTRSMKLSDTATYLLYVTPTSDRGSLKFDVTLSDCNSSGNRKKIVGGLAFLGLVLLIASTDRSASKRQRGYSKLSTSEVMRMRRGL